MTQDNDKSAGKKRVAGKAGQDQPIAAKSTRGKDVSALFDALGIDAGRYQNSAHDSRVAKAEQEAESRWPLLSELREAYTQHESGQTSDTADSANSSQDSQTGATQQAPSGDWNLLDELSAQAEPAADSPDAGLEENAEPELEPRLQSQQSQQSEPEADVTDTTAAEPEPEDDTLAQVFGLEPESPVEDEQAQPAPDAHAETIPDTQHEAVDIHVAHPPVTAGTSARHQPELEAVFSRLRKKPDSQTTSKPDIQTPDQPTETPDVAEELPEKTEIFSQAPSEPAAKPAAKSSVLFGLIRRLRRRK